MSAKKKNTAAVRPVQQAATPVPVRFILSDAPGAPARLAVSGKGVKGALFITAGSTISIAPGRYAVVGEWSPNWDRRVFGGYAYSTPPLSVDCTVVVPEEGGDVPVPGVLRCFALTLGEDCERYLIRGYDGVMSPIKVPCFISGAWAVPSLDLISIPTPESGRGAKRYSLVTDAGRAKPGQMVLEYGKTYSFSPEPKSEE